MLPVIIVLLIFTLSQGTTIGGANASRWIRIPFVGIGFQTSTLAGLVLMVYVARYLAKNKEKVVARLLTWENGNKKPVGEIVSIIKQEDENDAVMKENNMPIEMLRALLLKSPLTEDYKSQWRFYKY